MTRIISTGDVTLISRPRREKRCRRPLDPKIFARVEGDVWAIYICIYAEDDRRRNDYRRIAVPLGVAEEFLVSQIEAVRQARLGAKEGKET